MVKHIYATNEWPFHREPWGKLGDLEENSLASSPHRTITRILREKPCRIYWYAIKLYYRTMNLSSGLEPWPVKHTQAKLPFVACFPTWLWTSQSHVTLLGNHYPNAQGHNSGHQDHDAWREGASSPVTSSQLKTSLGCSLPHWGLRTDGYRFDAQ